MQEFVKNKGLPWSTCKGFDTFCPVSEFISKEQIKDPHQLELALSVNGQTRQKGPTVRHVLPLVYVLPKLIQDEQSDMIFDVCFIFLSPLSKSELTCLGRSPTSSLTAPPSCLFPRATSCSLAHPKVFLAWSTATPSQPASQTSHPTNSSPHGTGPSKIALEDTHLLDQVSFVVATDP